LHHKEKNPTRENGGTKEWPGLPDRLGEERSRGDPATIDRASNGEIAAMMPVIEYVHAIEGRLRVKVVEVKGSPAHARQVETMFRAVEGIREVRANPITGNVLFLHDPTALAGREILGALIAAGYMGMGIDAGRERPQTVAEVAVVVAELLSWAILRGCNGFHPGQALIARLVEAATRFLLRFLVGRAAALA
jgi:hypothetical protein